MTARSLGTAVDFWRCSYVMPAPAHGQPNVIAARRFDRREKARSPDAVVVERCDTRIFPCDSVAVPHHVTLASAGSVSGTMTTRTVSKEPKPIKEARDKLLRTLDSAANRSPRDEWIIGSVSDISWKPAATAMRLESSRDRVEATRWWCEALTGLALHELEDYAASDTAFREAPQSDAGW